LQNQSTVCTEQDRDRAESVQPSPIQTVIVHHGGFTKAQKRRFFHTIKAQKKPLRKRNSDRYRDPQQRFTKPQTGQELGYFEVVDFVFFRTYFG